MLCTCTYMYYISMVILKLLLDSFYIHVTALLVQKSYAQSVWAGLVRNPAVQLYTLRDDAPVLWHLNHHKHNNYVLES
jgi:hypothetical protein